MVTFLKNRSDKKAESIVDIGKREERDFCP